MAQFRDFYAYLQEHHVPVEYQLTTDLMERPLTVHISPDETGKPRMISIVIEPIPPETTPLGTWMINLAEPQGIWWDNQFIPALKADGTTSSLHQALKLSVKDLHMQLQFEELKTMFPEPDLLDDVLQYSQTKLVQWREEIALAEAEALAALEAAQSADETQTDGEEVENGETTETVGDSTAEDTETTTEGDAETTEASTSETTETADVGDSGDSISDNSSENSATDDNDTSTTETSSETIDSGDDTSVSTTEGDATSDNQTEASGDGSETSTGGDDLGGTDTGEAVSDPLI